MARELGGRMRWIALCVAIAALAAPALGATAPFTGRYAFRTYADDDGLTSLSTTALLQDRVGFLWVGTADGLFRLEGSAFARFGVDDGLPSSRIQCLHETRDGRLYAGTRSGLARWDGARFVTLKGSAGLPDASILSLASDAQLLFVGTGKGLYQSLAENFQLEARKDGPETAVTGLHVDPKGALFFARGGVLYRREGSLVTEFGSKHGLPPLDRIDTTLTDREGNLHVRTPTRLLTLPKDGKAFVAADDGLAPAAAAGLLSLEPSGALLVPTRIGLARREPGTTVFESLGRREGLEAETVLTALVDREGSLWIGLAGVGLLRRLGTGAFTARNEASGLSHDVVWAITRQKGRGGALFVGTQDGLNRIDADGGVRELHVKDGLAGNSVVALAADADGGIWAGSYPGGVTYLPASGSPRRFSADGLSAVEFQALAIHVRSNGEVWCGTTAGAYRRSAKGDRFERVTSAGAEEQDAIFAFAESAGELYAAGRLGLARLTGKAPKRFGRRSGLKADFVSSLLALPDGSLLLAFREGGSQKVTVDGDRLLISPFGEDAKMERLLFLGRDAAGGIWLGGAGAGVAVYRGDGGAPLRFEKDDGLPSRDVVQNAFFADAGGVVWFGTSRGLVRYRPGLDSSVDAPVPIALTSVTTAGKKLRVDKPAVLAAGERSLHVSWAGLSSQSVRLRYRYHVPGLFPKPLETTRSEAEIVGLSGGDYRFEVVALTPSGKASPAPATFAFTVTPALQETWAFRLGVVALLVGAVAFIMNRRSKHLLAEREKLRDEISRQDLEISSLKRQLDEASLSDTLTQTRNRRFFFETVQADVERAIRAYSAHGTPAERRTGELVSYLIAIDGLDAVMKRYGHAAEDAVLAETASRLREIVRGSDYLVRWGEPEFLIVTRASGRDQGFVLAQRILAIVGEKPFSIDGATVRLTASVGWIPFPVLTSSPSALPYDEVLRLTEKVVAEARQAGGNRAFGTLAAAEGVVAERLREAFRVSPIDAPEVKVVVSEGPRVSA